MMSGLLEGVHDYILYIIYYYIFYIYKFILIPTCYYLGHQISTGAVSGDHFSFKTLRRGSCGEKNHRGCLYMCSLLTALVGVEDEFSWSKMIRLDGLPQNQYVYILYIYIYFFTIEHMCICYIIRIYIDLQWFTYSHMFLHHIAVHLGWFFITTSRNGVL